MTINDLKTSISEMERKEALSLVLARRESRMISKRKKRKKKKKDPISLDTIETALNDEQLVKFYEKLKEQAE